VTLISVTGLTIWTPNGLAADMNKPGTQKAVCRNCNGSGAVICKGFTSLLSFVCTFLMLNVSTVLVSMGKQGVLLFPFLTKKTEHVSWNRDFKPTGLLFGIAKNYLYVRDAHILMPAKLLPYFPKK
jgi:hypothetical protein